MKKQILVLMVLCSTCTFLVNGQDSNMPEPACACSQPELIVTLGGRLNIGYKEIGILTMDDGSFLLRDGDSDKFYIVKGGVTQGPFNKEDPKIAGFEEFYFDSQDINDLVLRYKGILSKSGEKYLIKMGGKTYGPYNDLYDFTVSRSGDKFAVLAVTQENEMPKLVTNIPGATFDIVNTLGAELCGGIKYDEILIITEDKILNLQGKTLFNIKSEMYNCDLMFINTSNTKYAFYDFGTLTFSDNTSLPDTFNPYLLKVGSTVNLAYMYYSPRRNAIMQCKIPF
jgi:hypothetical protein